MAANVGKVLERLGVEVRNEGRRWWGRKCPHPEHVHHNPKHEWKNFFVRANGQQRAGQWHCYSCKNGGTLTELVMLLEEIEFREAIEWLRDIDDVPAPPVVALRYETRMRPRFEMPDEVEYPPFDLWTDSPRAYALGRGITQAQVERWNIGLCFEGRLRHRIVFPIRDHLGVPSNYAARTFVDDETRYLAADEETEHPDTSVMLGEHFWPVEYSRRAASSVVVFEGAISGMALERVVEELVRTSSIPATRAVYFAGLQGSAVDHRRIAKLALFGQVIVGSDPDEAGDAVAEAIAAPLAKRHIRARRMRYPHRGVDAAAEDPRWLALALAPILAA